MSMPITNMWPSCNPQNELIAILPIRVANLRTIQPTHFGCSKFQKIHPTDITLRTLYIQCAVLVWNHDIPIIFWIRWIKYIEPTCSVCCDDLHKLPLWRLQRWLLLVTLGCTQAPLVYNYGKTTNPKVLTLWIIFLDLVKGTMALILVAGCSYWVC